MEGKKKMKYLKYFEASKYKKHGDKNIDSLLPNINASYIDQFKIKHREDYSYYDIYYNNGQNGWIFIGIYDSYDREFVIFLSDSISNYSSYEGPSSGGKSPHSIEWKTEFSEFAFDVFVNKWYDILDEL